MPGGSSGAGFALGPGASVCHPVAQATNDFTLLHQVTMVGKVDTMNTVKSDGLR